MAKKFEPVTLVNDAGDTVEVKTKADYNHFVLGYGYKPEQPKTAKKAEVK